MPPFPKKDKRIKPPQGKPLVAIIIDDMGYSKMMGGKMLDLNLDLSFAFLPAGPYTQQLSQTARQRGRDILLHLPLEATDPKWNSSPGILLVSMSKGKLQSVFMNNLSVVPMAIGINNHMGSRFTENKAAMKKLLELARDKNLFFLDSLTSSKSVGYELAKEMGINALRRNVFLDNEKEKVSIIAQLEKLMSIAEKKGCAVGIGHPHPETYKALTEYQGQLQTRVTLTGIHLLAQSLQCETVKGENKLLTADHALKPR